MDAQRPKVNGLQAAPHQLMIRPAQQHFDLATPDNFHIFGVVIERDLLLENIQCDDKQQWESTSLLKNLNPQHGCWSLVELIRQVLDTESVLGKRLLHFSSGQSPSGQSRSGQLSQGQSSHSQAALQQVLVSAVIDRLGQFAVSEHNESRSYATRRQALLRLYRHLDNNGDYPMSVAEMASIACVSQRTLQYCFEQELGVSPIAFLRECRLNAVRRALIVTDQEKTISELALQYGFYHLGTFNQYYKLLFGETPSQTRDRADRYERAALVKSFTPQR
ncbi:helix-turn-helix domain-containing protein [Vibrio sp. ABG19]|nr:helix-turn-helix domain-containing protein [Vibrio sp. ABG19]